MSHTMPSQEMLSCMRDCVECASICAQCLHHCLHMGGEHAAPDHQGLMRDCEEICGVAASFMSRSSHQIADLCRVCAAVCTECGDSCDRLANGDALMKQCAQTCRRCAQSCEQMSTANV